MNKENADKLLNIRVPKTLFEKFQDKCNENYKTMSEALRDLMQQYIFSGGVVHKSASIDTQSDLELRSSVRSRTKPKIIPTNKPKKKPAIMPRKTPQINPC